MSSSIRPSTLTGSCSSSSRMSGRANGGSVTSSTSARRSSAQRSTRTAAMPSSVARAIPAAAPHTSSASIDAGGLASVGRHPAFVLEPDLERALALAKGRAVLLIGGFRLHFQFAQARGEFLQRERKLAGCGFKLTHGACKLVVVTHWSGFDWVPRERSAHGSLRFARHETFTDWLPDFMT